jgi:hypothetical protein
VRGNREGYGPGRDAECPFTVDANGHALLVETKIDVEGIANSRRPGCRIAVGRKVRQDIIGQDGVVAGDLVVSVIETDQSLQTVALIIDTKVLAEILALRAINDEIGIDWRSVVVDLQIVF